MQQVRWGLLGLALGLWSGASLAQASRPAETYEYVYLRQVQVAANGTPTYQVASVVFPQVGPCEVAQMVNLLRYPVVIYGRTYWIDEPHVGVRPIPGCGQPPAGVACE